MARIVITDDSAAIRLLLKEYLIRQGHLIVGEAKNGREAIELCLEVKPDLVMMDLNMPVMDGVEALCEIKKMNKNIKVIILSAINHPNVVLKVMRAGANGFIKKPFDRLELIKTVEKTLNS